MQTMQIIQTGPPDGGHADGGRADGGRADGVGAIVLAATPIGNRADVSARLLEVLAGADVIAAEDTRRARALLRALQVSTDARVVAHHEHNERTSAAGLVALAARGGVVVVISDAGMPSISDPGYRLVRAAIEAGVTVTCVPGPSAVSAALAVSGLPSDRFTFEGFAPRRPGERDRRLAELAAEPRTMVFFEAPHRVAALLTAMAGVFGPDRAAVLCRELTKVHEEVRRGSLADLVAVTEGGVLGEVTLVVAGAPARPAEPADVVDQVQALVADGLRLREAVKRVARAAGVGGSDLYAAVQASRR